MLKSELFYTKLEQFYILISQLQSSKSLTVINNLINNAFKYWIILSDNVVSFITSTYYNFNLLTDL